MTHILGTDRQIKEIIVHSNDIFYDHWGTLAVCHGLRKASYLNGKIGDIRSWNKETERNQVYFEDSTLQPSKVEMKLENLRLIFDLPA